MLILARLVQAFADDGPRWRLASIHALFPANERGRALGLYGVTIGLASVVGQLLGGVLVDADIAGLGWRLIFLINLPIAAITFVAALRLLRNTRAPNRTRIDLGGIVLSSAALASFVVPLVEGRQYGWPWWSIAMLLTTPIYVELFRRYESRLAGHGGVPLVAFEVLRTPGLLRGHGAIMTLYAIATFFLVYSIYLQSALGFTALQAGLAILPFSVGFLTGSTASPRIGRWTGQAAPSLGFLLSAAGAIGISVPTMVRVIVERVEPDHAGLVGGMASSTLQLSSAVGMLVLAPGYFITSSGSVTIRLRYDSRLRAHAAGNCRMPRQQRVPGRRSRSAAPIPPAVSGLIGHPRRRRRRGWPGPTRAGRWPEGKAIPQTQHFR